MLAKTAEREKVSEVKRLNIVRLKSLGFNWEEIGVIYGVSRTLAYAWGCPSTIRDSYRRTTLGTVDEHGKPIVVTGLHKRPHPGACEACGTTAILHYHHWIKKNYNLGVWLCNSHHMAAEALEKMPNFPEVYAELKRNALEYVKEHMLPTGCYQSSFLGWIDRTLNRSQSLLEFEQRKEFIL